METITTDVEDIAAFADPYTEVKTRPTKDGTRIDISKNGRPIYFEVKHSDGRVVEGARQRVYPNIPSLLASERFANLSALADTQLRAIASRRTKSTIPPIPAFVSVGGKLLSTSEFAPELATATRGKLRLVLLDGPAGVGKTFQIEQLVALQARRLKSGEAAAPLLHVTSRGRRLSNLRDVLAASTQDVSASFFAKHVPILVRRGLLSIAIDGFDELVDADGYEDSWLALRQFLADVGEGGGVLLAARDTFVEEQELLTRIERTKKQVELIIGEVKSPSPDQARAWLSLSTAWKPAELQSDVADDILRAGSYGLRPFFLRELWAAKGWSDVVDTGPRTYLVNRLLGREAALIAQQLGGTTKEKVLSPLVVFLQEVAMEMLSRETDSVEVEHLSFLTQFCFEGIVDEASIKKLMHKSGSLALLELTPEKGARRFPHSEIRDYFVGSAILKSLSEGTVPSFLRRHILTSEELEVFQEVFVSNDQEARAAVRVCGSLLASEVSSDSLAPNLSALMILWLALGYVERVDFAEVVEATFAGQTPTGFISEAQVSRLDACGADLSRLKFDHVQIGTLVVDDSTAFGESIPDVDALEIRSGQKAKVLRNKQQILDWISRRYEASDGGSDGPRVRLLEKVARRAVRHFYLRPGSDEDEGAVLLSDPLWSDVFRVLNGHSRVDVLRAKAMHGRPSPLVRVKNPLALLDRSNKETAKIIAEVAAQDASQAKVDGGNLRSRTTVARSGLARPSATPRKAEKGGGGS